VNNVVLERRNALLRKEIKRLNFAVFKLKLYSAFVSLLCLVFAIRIYL